MDKNIKLIMNDYIKSNNNLKNVENFENSDYEFSLINSNTEYELKGFVVGVSLENVIIPTTHNGKNVVSIAGNAFETKPITSVTIPDTITSIGSSAFKQCTLLTTVDINLDTSNLKSIGFHAFYKSKISSINIPDTVTIINDEAFFECNSLATINIKNTSNLTYIGAQAFSDSRITNINIPKNVTKIDYNAFDKCTLLQTVYFYGKLPIIVTTIEFSTIALGAIGYYYPEYSQSWSGITNINKLTIKQIETLKTTTATTSTSTAAASTAAASIASTAVLTSISTGAESTSTVVPIPTTVGLSSIVSYQEGIKQISDTEISIEINKLLLVDNDINEAINKILKNIYTDNIPKYDVVEVGDKLYVYIDANAELFSVKDKIKEVIFVFINKTDKAINNLLNIDLSSFKSTNYINYLLIVISILVIIFLFILAS